MSDLVIRSGGVVEVDTASLRAAASRLRAIAADADEITATWRGSPDLLLDVGGPPTADLFAVGSALAHAADLAVALASAVDGAADLYEAVELLAQRAAAVAAGDASAVARWDDRITTALPGRPDLWEEAKELLAGGADRRELDRQAWLGSLGLGPALAWTMPLALGAFGMGVDALRRGPVSAAERLGGRPDPVAVRRVSTSNVAPPATLAAAAARIPGGAEARVRVERYTMPGGGRQFAVYVTGTRSVLGPEPFDLGSNLELYSGERSASYEAAVAALEAAGARPGDVVHALGHSQGAMITERLALEGPYDVRTLVSFGSPIQADVPADTLAVTIRHTDDPIAALQGGGHAAPVGAAGSFIVERSADPAAGLHDVLLPAHQMTAYSETAALIDASEDPRAAGLREVFRELGEAERVVAQDYAAERVSPSGGGGTERPGWR